MIDRIGALLGRLGTEDSERTSVGAREGDLRQATAILLMSVAKTDMDLNAAERTHMVELLAEHFALSDEDAQDLVEVAEHEAEEVVSLQRFTRELHEQLSEEEKRLVVEMIWRVVIADGEVDRHEAALANKIARLLYLREAEVAMVRVKVLDELEQKG